MGVMTSRERVEAAVAHREPDRTPVFEYVLLPPTADRFLGRPYAGAGNWANVVRDLGWEEAVRQRAVDRPDLAWRLGHDLLYVTPNPLPPGPGSAPAPLIRSPGLTKFDCPCSFEGRREDSSALRPLSVTTPPPMKGMFCRCQKLVSAPAKLGFSKMVSNPSKRSSKGSGSPLA